MQAHGAGITDLPQLAVGALEHRFVLPDLSLQPFSSVLTHSLKWPEKNVHVLFDGYSFLLYVLHCVSDVCLANFIGAIVEKNMGIRHKL